MKAGKFGNDRKIGFLGGIPEKSCNHPESEHASYSKFCFAYFTIQPAGQDFGGWDHQKLIKLMNKVSEYGKETLKHWEQEPVGKGKGRVLTLYGRFPDKSEFTLPKHVPNDARWGRFRLDYKTRLVGFVVPDALHGQFHQNSRNIFDANTFYVVFLDGEHKFYCTEDP